MKLRDLLSEDEHDDYNKMVDEYEKLEADAQKEFDVFFKKLKNKYKPLTKKFDKAGMDPIMTGKNMWTELEYNLKG